MIPIEMKLDDWGLPFEAPGAYSRGTLADTRLVDEDDQAPFSLGFFLSVGQVRRFQARTASSSRSIARLSGFWGLKPKLPRIRQTCVCPMRTPCKRSMTAPTRLSVQSSVPIHIRSGFAGWPRAQQPIAARPAGPDVHALVRLAVHQYRLHRTTFSRCTRFVVPPQRPTPPGHILSPLAAFDPLANASSSPRSFVFVP